MFACGVPQGLGAQAWKALPSPTTPQLRLPGHPCALSECLGSKRARCAPGLAPELEHNREVLTLTVSRVRASDADLPREESPGVGALLSTENLLGQEVQAAPWPLLASSSSPSANGGSQTSWSPGAFQLQDLGFWARRLEPSAHPPFGERSLGVLPATAAPRCQPCCLSNQLLPGLSVS